MSSTDPLSSSSLVDSTPVESDVEWHVTVDTPMRLTHVELQNQLRTEEYVWKQKNTTEDDTYDGDSDGGAPLRMGPTGLMSDSSAAHEYLTNSAFSSHTAEDDEKVTMTRIELKNGSTLRTDEDVIHRQLAPLYKARTFGEIQIGIQQAEEVRLHYIKYPKRDQMQAGVDGNNSSCIALC